jgi:hypothetical protein
MGDGSCEISILLAIKSAESLSIKILTRGFGYHKEVRVVRIWSDMYRDHGEYISTWLETRKVREWTDVPLQTPLFYYLFSVTCSQCQLLLTLTLMTFCVIPVILYCIPSHLHCSPLFFSCVLQVVSETF